MSFICTTGLGGVGRGITLKSKKKTRLLVKNEQENHTYIITLLLFSFWKVHVWSVTNMFE